MLILGIMIPFLGTVLGSFIVFFMKNKYSIKLEKILLGFASGVMIAASIWSLILPSIEMSKKQHVISYIPAAVGLLFGVLFLMFSNKIFSCLKNMVSKKNNKMRNIKKTTMIIFAVTLHNIPEGMAVGVNFAGALNKMTGITFMSAFIFSFGIAIQNIPEGAIISMPLKSSNTTKFKAFIHGILSGIVEPIFALLTLAFSTYISLILPYLLSFAAGAMIFVVIDELVPDFNKNSNSYLPIIFFTIGFIIMMALDVALG